MIYNAPSRFQQSWHMSAFSGWDDSVQVYSFNRQSNGMQSWRLFTEHGQQCTENMRYNRNRSAMLEHYQRPRGAP